MSRDRFKFLTRGQHASSTVRRHVSHGFDSQSETLMPGRCIHILILCLVVHVGASTQRSLYKRTQQGLDVGANLQCRH